MCGIGYGFLSENAEFAGKVEKAGLIVSTAITIPILFSVTN